MEEKIKLKDYVLSEDNFLLSNFHITTTPETHFSADGNASGARLKFSSVNTGSNSDRKTLEITGGQFTEAMLEDLQNGFRITFEGNFEEAELIAFFKRISEQPS